MGSSVAFELAIRHPERVGKLIVTGNGTSYAGMHPGVIEGIEHITPEVFAGSPWEKAGVAGDVVGLPQDRAILPGTTHVTLIQRAWRAPGWCRPGAGRR
jgi:pimeloyl-ACP methyl ester carboxylesterase